MAAAPSPDRSLCAGYGPHMTLRKASLAAFPSLGRSPLKFFLLVFALSIPFWLIGGLTGLQLMPELSVSALMAFCPMVAALILVHREGGTAGVAELLKGSLDLALQQHGQERVCGGFVSRHTEPHLDAVPGLRLPLRYAPWRPGHGRRGRHGHRCLGTPDAGPAKERLIGAACNCACPALTAFAPRPAGPVPC